MKKIRLGKSNLEVSSLGLGCINFGSSTDEKTSFALMDTYLENGGNFLDTANNYAIWNEGSVGGESEKVIGNWIENRVNRKDIILATKMGAFPKDGTSKDFSNMQGLGRATILEAVEKSLYNLKSDYIDLLYLHVDDYTTSQLETMSTLDELIKKGYVREIGCSNFQTWRLERARHICESNNLHFFCAIQQRYSYLAPALDWDFDTQVTADRGLEQYISFYRDITMVAHTPLLYGLYNKGYINQEGYDTLTNRKKLEKLLTDVKQPVPWVLKYITEQFGGSVVLFATANPAHLVENMKFLS